MVLNNGCNLLGWFLARMVADEIGIYAAFDQSLCNSTVKVVDAFNLSGLYRPLAAQTLVEFCESAALFEIGTLVVPELQQRAEFSISKRTPVLRQVGDWFPGKDH